MVLAIDVSIFTKQTSGDITQQQLNAAWNEGVRKFIVSIGDTSACYQQMDAIHKDGRFALETYGYIPFDDTWHNVFDLHKAIIQYTRDNIHDIQFHYFDWEDKWHQSSQTDKEFVCQFALDNFVGFCSSGFYSAYWYWTQYMQNTTRFGSVPWWVADYDGNADLVFYPQWGGITNMKMKQYFAGDAGGGTYVGGIWCDKNYYEEPVTEPTSPTPAPPDYILLPVSANQSYRFSVGK